MLTMQDQHWHEAYEAAPQEAKLGICAAFDAIVDIFNAHRLPFALDDRAEVMIAALTRFAVESGRQGRA